MKRRGKKQLKRHRRRCNIITYNLQEMRKWECEIDSTGSGCDPLKALLDTGNVLLCKAIINYLGTTLFNGGSCPPKFFMHFSYPHRWTFTRLRCITWQMMVYFNAGFVFSTRITSMNTLGSRPSAHICNHGEEQAMTTVAQEGTEDSLNVRLRRSALPHRQMLWRSSGQAGPAQETEFTRRV